MTSDLPRRTFIKTVVLGTAGSTLGLACGVPDRSGAGGPTRVRLGGLPGSESFTTCHAVRDGLGLPVPPVSESRDVVVVGGGLSGLAAAYRLRDEDLLLLEKEPRVGGNALRSSWNGIDYSTGATLIVGRHAHLRLLCEEVGLEPVRLTGRDVRTRTYFLEGRRLQDLDAEFGRRHPHAVESLGRFRREMLALDVAAHRDELDRVTFAELLRPYHPAVRRWHDMMVDWLCCDSATTSGLGGALMAKHWLGAGFKALLSPRVTDDEVVSFPGGLGFVSERLAARVEEAGRDRVRTGATVHRIEDTGSGWVEVSYLADGHAVTVRARTVIVAAPKLIARHVVRGLPAGQRDAMARLRYTPYLVVALCFRRRFVSDPPHGARCLDSVVGVWNHPLGAGTSRHGEEGPHIVRALVPRRAHQRSALLEEEGPRRIVARVVDFFEEYYPGIGGRIEEARVHRRGHNWFVPVPRGLTRYQPLASRPLGRILFAHSDSVGVISDSDWAVHAADRAVALARHRLARSTTGKRKAVLRVARRGGGS